MWGMGIGQEVYGSYRGEICFDKCVFTFTGSTV